MRKTFAVLHTAPRARFFSTLLLLTLTVPACGDSARADDPEMPDHRSSVAARDVRTPEPEPAIRCDDAVVVNGGLTDGVTVMISPEPPASRRESEARQLLEAAAESPKAGFFARVLQPLLLRVARRIIALQFRELITGGTP